MRLLVVLVPMLAAPAYAQDLSARVERDGVSVRFFAGAEVRDVDSDGWRATVQGLGDIVLGLVRAPRDWDHDPRETLTHLRVCGAPAERREIHRQRSEARGSYLDANGTVQHLPPYVQAAQVEVQLVFARAGQYFMLRWVVPSGQRERARAREQAFFRSLRCR